MANSVINRSTLALERAGIRRAKAYPTTTGVGKASFWFVSLGGYFFLWAPIVLLVVFSFNDARTVNTWHGFTFKWYENILTGATGGETSFATDLMLNSLANSLFVGVMATIIATLMGTMVALSLARGTYPGKRYLEGLLLLPVIIPEITQGVSLAMFFKIIFDFIEQSSGTRALPGFGSIIIGHVVFNISYVAVVVRARLADMNPRLEEAANDLGANGWQTFWRITFPLMMPGILAGALLAFTLSLDDFVVTFFLSGIGTTTLPVFVYGLLKVSVTPDINAISTLMLIISTVLIGISLLLQNRSLGRS
jgi:spermidine/putrescine transport system permease protein